jgi:hypothetical protein
MIRARLQVREVSGQGGSLGVHQRPDAARVIQVGCRFWCSHSGESPVSGAIERWSVWSATDQPPFGGHRLWLFTKVPKLIMTVEGGPGSAPASTVARTAETFAAAEVESVGTGGQHTPEDPLYQLALRMVRRSADAEDATQEILIRGDHPASVLARRGSPAHLGAPDRRELRAEPAAADPAGGAGGQSASRSSVVAFANNGGYGTRVVGGRRYLQRLGVKMRLTG